MDADLVTRLAKAYTDLSESLQRVVDIASGDVALRLDPTIDPLRILLLVSSVDGFTAEESATIGELVGLGFSESTERNDPDLVAAFGAYLANQPQLAPDPDRHLELVTFAEEADQSDGKQLAGEVRAALVELVSAAAAIDGIRSAAEQRLRRSLE